MELGGGVTGGGGREIIYLSLHCHHQNDFCIEMGSDESHFNILVGSDGQSHRTVSTYHSLFRNRSKRVAFSTPHPHDPYRKEGKKKKKKKRGEKKKKKKKKKKKRKKRLHMNRMLILFHVSVSVSHHLFWYLVVFLFCFSFRFASFFPLFPQRFADRKSGSPFLFLRLLFFFFFFVCVCVCVCVCVNDLVCRLRYCCRRRTNFVLFDLDAVITTLKVSRSISPTLVGTFNEPDLV